MNFVYRWLGKLASSKLGLQEGTLDGTKPWYKSLTIWSDVLTIVVAIIGFVDLRFTGGKIASSSYYQGILALLAGIGIKGRVSADTKIG